MADSRKKKTKAETEALMLLFRTKGGQQDANVKKLVDTLMELQVGESLLITEAEAKKHWKENFPNAISHLTRRRPEIGHFRVGGISGKGWLVVKLAKTRTEDLPK